jgi:phytoene synthase
MADDIVDHAPPDQAVMAVTELDALERELDEPEHPVMRAFAATRQQYRLPDKPIRELLEGVRADLQPGLYRTWIELEAYCYAVAGTVGLIVAPILGCRDDAALVHAAELGIAMQLTNVLRDIAEDATRGRLYLPLDELDAFGCCPESILAGEPSGRFRDFLRFQIDRARGLYTAAERGIPALDPAGRVAVLAASRFYAGILRAIEDQHYDVFARRAHVSTSRKARAMPRLLIQAAVYRGGYHA